MENDQFQPVYASLLPVSIPKVIFQKLSLQVLHLPIGQVRPEHLVADLCAAPGSKTLQLLAAMGSAPQGLLVANDDHWQRSASALRRC